MPRLTKGCGPIADETPSLVGCGMGGVKLKTVHCMFKWVASQVIFHGHDP